MGVNVVELAASLDLGAEHHWNFFVGVGDGFHDQERRVEGESGVFWGRPKKWTIYSPILSLFIGCIGSELLPKMYD